MKKPALNEPKVKCTKITDGRWSVTCPGSPEIRIYETANRARNTVQFNVVYYAVGKRKIETRMSLEAAKLRGEQVAKELAKGDAAISPISAQDRVIFERAKGLLAPLGMGMDKAALLISEAYAKLGGRSLAAAVDYYVSHSPAEGHSSKSVREVKEMFLAARRCDGCGDRHMVDLEHRLDKFAESFQCAISSVTTEVVSDWLRGLSNITGRTRNNYRNALRNFFRFAAAQRLINREQINWDEDNGVALARETDGAIEIFSPKELISWIEAARTELHPERLPAGFNRKLIGRPGLVPFLVLGAFAGMRSSEIQAQRWEDIDLERGYIRVTKAKGNTPAKRLIPISENLKAWLSLYKKSGGPVSEIIRTEQAIRKLGNRAGLSWRHNGLRHSYISYQMAIHHDAAKVSSWAGNSPARVHKNYRELVTPEEAAAWFALTPESTGM